MAAVLLANLTCLNLIANIRENTAEGAWAAVTTRELTISSASVDFRSFWKRFPKLEPACSLDL
jgi:hypothetical protein